MTDNPTPLVRRVQEALYSRLIDVHPVESVRDGWYEADCDTCLWATAGGETTVEDAAYQHITDVHMTGWDEIFVPMAREFFAREFGLATDKCEFGCRVCFPDPYAACPQHGEQECRKCHANPGDCHHESDRVSCGYWRAKGMHWDTCPNRRD